MGQDSPWRGIIEGQESSWRGRGEKLDSPRRGQGEWTGVSVDGAGRRNRTVHGMGRAEGKDLPFGEMGGATGPSIKWGLFSGSAQLIMTWEGDPESGPTAHPGEGCRVDGGLTPSRWKVGVGVGGGG